MVRSTFTSFYTANSAINASQRGLDVTGQNIANANTRGYSRQRVDLYSLSPTGIRQKYALTSPSCGSGVGVGSISQARDPYLDIRFRTEQSDFYSTASQLDSLKQLENIFNDVTGQGLTQKMEDLIAKLQSLSLDPTSPELSMLFRSSAGEFCNLLNNYANQLEQTKDLTIKTFEESEVRKANQLLENIALINQQINQNQLHNVGTNELMDHRNLMLDELSSYLKIETLSSTEVLSNGTSLTKLTVNLLCADGTKLNLVNDDQFTNLNFKFDETTQKASIELVQVVDPKDPSKNVSLGDIEDQISTGSVKGFLNFINSAGIYDTPPNEVRGIRYYEEMLNTMASTFANVFNQANELGDGTKRPLFAASDDKSNLDPSNITAKNITIAAGWLSNDYGITTTKTAAPDASGLNDNILNMISLFSKEMDFTTGAGSSVYKGSLLNFFSFTTATLATDINNMDKLVETREIVLSNIESDRLSISSVSLDEEAMNMMMFQKSYNAAARYMTTIDQALDTIINGMGLVGK